MKRKEFINRTLGTLAVAIPAMTLIGCSGSDSGDGNPDPEPNPDPNPGANCLEDGTNASITANHGHSLTVSQQDVAAGVEKTYSIQGSATHDHSVTLTASDFTTLQGNTSISKLSTSGDGHTHNVMVSCA